MKATLYRRFDDVLVALFRAGADIKAKHSLNMIGIKKEMFHNSHLFYESLAEGYKKQCSTGSYPPLSKVPTPSGTVEGSSPDATVPTKIDKISFWASNLPLSS